MSYGGARKRRSSSRRRSKSKRRRSSSRAGKGSKNYKFIIVDDRYNPLGDTVYRGSTALQVLNRIKSSLYNRWGGDDNYVRLYQLDGPRSDYIYTFKLDRDWDSTPSYDSSTWGSNSLADLIETELIKSQLANDIARQNVRQRFGLFNSYNRRSWIDDDYDVGNELMNMGRRMKRNAWETTYNPEVDRMTSQLPSYDEAVEARTRARLNLANAPQMDNTTLEFTSGGKRGRKRRSKSRGKRRSRSRSRRSRK